MIKTLFGAIIGAALVMAAYTYGWSGTPAQQQAKVETAFERVQRTGELRCGYFSWPPYVMRDPNTNELTGINIDMINAVAADLGWKVVWEAEVGVGEVTNALQAGKFDIMCATLWPDGARAKNLLLSVPAFYTGLYAIVRSDDTRFDGNLAKLNEEAVTLAAIDGDATSTIAKSNYPKAKIHALPQTADVSHLLLAVADGKADAVIIGLGDIKVFNATNNNRLRAVAGVAAAHVFAESFGMQPDELRLKAAIDSVLTRLNDNGLAASLIAKYQMQGYFAPRPAFAAE